VPLTGVDLKSLLDSIDRNGTLKALHARAVTGA
jgi:hypothetical protein